MHGQPVTEKQTAYVRAMQRRLHLPDLMLDGHCKAQFGAVFRALDRRQVSELIDEMVGWESIPGQLRREMGQRALPGFDTP